MTRLEHNKGEDDLICKRPSQFMQNNILTYLTAAVQG